jgi:hypothetical protein
VAEYWLVIVPQDELHCSVLKSSEGYMSSLCLSILGAEHVVLKNETVNVALTRKRGKCTVAGNTVLWPVVGLRRGRSAT